MSVLLERERTAPAVPTEATADVTDLLDVNGRRWRTASGGMLRSLTPGGRVDPLERPVPVEAVEMLCGPLRPVPAVTA